jgi:hypothetical protein
MSVGGAASRGDSDVAILGFLVIAGIVALSVLFANQGSRYAAMQPGFGPNQIRPGQTRMIPAQTLITRGGEPAPATKEFGDFGVLPVPSSPLLAASDLAGVGKGDVGYGSLDEAFPDPLRRR